MVGCGTQPQDGQGWLPRSRLQQGRTLRTARTDCCSGKRALHQRLQQTLRPMLIRGPRLCRRVLPCVVDVGTDNESLQNLDLYMGLHQPRITDQELYRDIMDEVRTASMSVWRCIEAEDGGLAAASTYNTAYSAIVQYS